MMDKNEIVEFIQRRDIEVIGFELSLIDVTEPGDEVRCFEHAGEFTIRVMKVPA
jgi:hypothetical protein